MPNFFQKINNGSKMFNKVGNDGDFFKKVSVGARKIDNSVARIGNFLVPTLNNINPALGSLVENGVNQVHQIRNNLERSINAPLEELRNNHNNIYS